MNSHEPFYGAVAGIVDGNRQRPVVDYCLAAHDYLQELRGRVDGPAAAEIDLLDAVLARAIGLAMRGQEGYDGLVGTLARRHPEQFIYTLVTICAAPIPRRENAYRQILIAVENLFDHRRDVESSLALFDVLLGMINVSELATTYKTIAGHDAELLDRILDKRSAPPVP